MQAKNQGELLGFSVFEDRVTVAIPVGSRFFRLLLAFKLFQDFVQTKFAEDIFFEKLPATRGEARPFRKRNDCGLDALEIEIRMDDLLRRDRRIFEDFAEIFPAGVGLEELLGEIGAVEIGEKQLVANDKRGFG